LLEVLAAAQWLQGRIFLERAGVGDPSVQRFLEEQNGLGAA
jgi:hypothetical protein